MVSDLQNIVFYWQLNGETVVDSIRRYQEGSTLHISRVDRVDDHGEFTCIAMNRTTGFSMTSDTATLTIQWIEEVASIKVVGGSRKDEELKMGQNITLRCKADGYPKPDFQWLRNGKIIQKDETHHHHNHNHHHHHHRANLLHVFGVSAKNNGAYSCRARNQAGWTRSEEDFLLRIRDPSSPYLVNITGSLLVRASEPAMLSCRYEGASLTEWLLDDGTMILNDSRITVYPNGSLLVPDVQPTDERTYTCRGWPLSKSEEFSQEYTTSLRIARIDDFGERSFEPRPQAGIDLAIAIEGSRFERMCLAPGGLPKPRTWWESPKRKVIWNAGRIRADGQVLVIDKVRVEDHGNYTCVAENLAGSRWAQLEIFVSVAPVMVRHPANIVVDEGEEAAFSCSYKGSKYPVTRISWLHEGRRLVPNDWHLLVDEKVGILKIRSAQASDNGAYACQVNSFGFPPVNSTAATLLVKERMKFAPSPVNKKLELGSKARVPCKAKASSPVTVKWLKNRSFEWPPHVRDDNGTLLFDGVQPGDAGLYTCIATSAQGIINTSIKIDVIVLPKFVLKPLDPTEAFEGRPLTIPCKARGDPKPAIQWDKNQVPNGFDPQRFHVLENGSLTIEELRFEDEGKYGCTAGNAAGFSREEFTLIVRGEGGFDGTGMNQDSVIMQTVIITLSVAAAYVILVIVLSMWCRHQRTHRKKRLQLEGMEATPLNREPAGEAEGPGGHGGVTPRHAGDPADESPSLASELRDAPAEKLHIGRQQLISIARLGVGEFGEVHVASVSNVGPVVMMKMLQVSSEQARADFRREADTYKKFRHPGVARLLTLLKKTEPHLAVFEYTEWGDLKQFLLATSQTKQLSQVQMTRMCLQLAQGMEYLSGMHFLHRDLACRNCLVTPRLDLKISCPCLCREGYKEEYFHLQNALIPLRWWPAEAVLDGDFSTKSDVWSFACTAWEVFNHGDLPLSHLSNEEVLRSLRNKKLSWQPPHAAPSDLKVLLGRCWSAFPWDRPSFQVAAETLSAVLDGYN